MSGISFRRNTLTGNNFSQMFNTGFVSVEHDQALSSVSRTASCCLLYDVFGCVPRRRFAVDAHPRYPVERVIGITDRIPVSVGDLAEYPCMDAAACIRIPVQQLRAHFRLGFAGPARRRQSCTIRQSCCLWCYA